MVIENVSDTARWVAAYRAMETARPDAIFRDPFAAKLAGKRGFQIADAMSQKKEGEASLVVRTVVLDTMVSRLVSQDADVVLNLAAGLDTRPWRLNLPSSLQWIDVDLPDILAYKAKTLEDTQPLVKYQTIAADLADAGARRDVLSRIGKSGKRILVVSEGLLVYLSTEDVEALARDLHDQQSFCWWAFDLISPVTEPTALFTTTAIPRRN
jgi:methyltransferase (TIGR00027 family)